jgi:hypothetical protein
VHHAAAVRVRERVGDLAEQAHRLADGQGSLACEPLAQRLAFHERHT